MQAVVGDVADVVDEVGGARGRAKGAEAEERLRDLDRIPKFRRENDPGEQ